MSWLQIRKLLKVPVLYLLELAKSQVEKWQKKPTPWDGKS